MDRAAVAVLILVVLSWLFGVFSYVAAENQSPAETSVPEPTRLGTVASADGSKVVWSEALGEIESSDARAAVSVIEIEGLEGETVRGVKIMLDNSTSSDQIYLTDNLISNLQDELEFLEFSRQFHDDDVCQAQRLCMHGIARCRPSQIVRQAYCLGRYTTPGSEEGLSFSTPRHSFKFPSVEIEQMSTLINEAIQALER